MRLLDRYLLRELLVPLVYCLSGFLLLWIVADLCGELHDLQAHRLSAVEVAQFYLVQVPGFLVFLLPITLLLALLYTLTNHARHHEITAIRAAGVSLWRLCVPYLAVGLLCGAVVFALNELWVPDSDTAAQQIRNRYVLSSSAVLGRKQIPKLGFTNFRDRRIWEIGLYNLETSEMLRPVVTSTQPDGSSLQLHAERAVRVGGVWTFYQASEYKLLAQTGALPVLLFQTNLLKMPAFSETPEQIKSALRIRNSLGTTSFRDIKKADVPIKELLNYLRLNPNPLPSESAWLYTKLYGRLATPWVCLVVVLIAIPFGAASGRRNVFVGVASSIVICFAFVILQQFCLALGSGGYLPAWLAGWLPNLAFGLAGLWLTARVR